LRAQTVEADHPEINGHFIGEPVTRFLRLEAEAREDVDVCRRYSARSSCRELLAAIDDGARAEISTSIPATLDNPDPPATSLEFVLDGGKVVKVSLPVDDVPQTLKKFGPPTHETDVPGQNASGAKWQNHLSVWDASGIHVTLYQDNNPSLDDHRPLLVVESAGEHAREDAASQAQNVAPQ
jgi:hypothetical protein